MNSQKIAPLSADDVHISYLPLAHVFERAVECALWGRGASIGFFQGDVLKLVDDIQELKFGKKNSRIINDSEIIKCSGKLSLN